MCKFQAADAAVMPAAGKARMAYSLAHAAPETAPADALAAPGAGPVMAAGPTVARIRLGAALRRMRAAARLDQEPAARALGATQPKIARIEGGMSAVRTQDVAALPGLYDVTAAALREEMLGLADLSREDGWWAPLSRDLTVANRHLLDLEAEASQIRVYDSQAIPALLQTDAYARAAASALAPDDRRWADRRGRGGLGTAALARRRGLLRLPDPPQVWALIQQAVLTRCPAANPAVLTGQLTELADLAAGRGIATPLILQIVPDDCAAAAVAPGPFSLLRYDHQDVPTVVLTEAMTTLKSSTAPGEVDHTMLAFGRLMIDALHPGQSLELLGELIARRQRQPPGDHGHHD